MDGGEKGVAIGAEAVFGGKAVFAASLADEIFIPAVKLEFPGGPVSGASLKAGQDFPVFFHQQKISLLPRYNLFPDFIGLFPPLGALKKISGGMFP
jgi:hypothetical protein